MLVLMRQHLNRSFVPRVRTTITQSTCEQIAGLGRGLGYKGSGVWSTANCRIARSVRAFPGAGRSTSDFGPIDLYREGGRRAGHSAEKLIVGLRAIGFLGDTTQEAADDF